ncbi:MAG TPA: dipeptide epimerase, partial [Bacteroidetes bacterium]|nr:dipeptide epimerase [Bacteroidota bacterium]
TLQFNHTFRVAGAADRDFTNIGILRIQSDKQVGYGEAAPSKFWSENLHMVQDAAAKINLDKHATPLVYELILREVKEEINPPQALLAALDMALFDCIGKKMNIPVTRFLGLDNLNVPQTSFTIGFADLDVIQEKVELAKDFAILKLKLGTSYDIEIVEKVRSLTDKPIRVDANEGWEREEAAEKIKWLETQNVELVEQPLKSDRIEDTLWIKERVNMPIIADESVKDSSDIEKITGAFDGINIKLMKSGGILEAIKMIRIARQHQLKVMIGCMMESSLGIAAACNLQSMVDYVDLDSHLLMKNDPFQGLSLINGKIIRAGSAGLGVQPVAGLFE